jgi:dihydropteroate synthase
MPPRTYQLRWDHWRLDLSSRTHIMGVLNVTPDSFSDGGRYLRPDRAVAHAERMADAGADVIDIGGESTRPGSHPVPLEEELRRVIPVIKRVAARCRLPISIDTSKAEVARRAIEAGAAMVNDVTALLGDPEMAGVVAGAGVPVDAHAGHARDDAAPPPLSRAHGGAAALLSQED